MNGDPELMNSARDLAAQYPYVEHQAYKLPEITGNLYIDTIQQSGFSTEEIQAFCQQLGQEFEVVCDQILRIVNSIGGGLNPASKKSWIIEHLSSGKNFSEMEDIANSYQDSPAT
jgi:hypothetical protein